MYQLIKKDVLVQKNSLLLSLVLIIFFSFTLSNMGTVGLIVGIITVTYQLVLGASALEEKVNSEIILISLPINKRTIVLSKYISIYVFAAYVILGFYVVDLLTSLFNVPFHVPFNSSTLMGSLAAITVLFSISFPLIFKYGYLKSKIINIILLFVAVFGGTFTIGNLMKNDHYTLGQSMQELMNSGPQWMIIMLIPLLMILAISYFISMTFFKNREF
ncbi:ABC-2 transporter permease [Bacillus sp. FJAT-29814]|uniref:ABC-2 transporter permease n=1 Tax=Bacillus sp. FJAT-29814 TaxID=1729688 RepID=UPI00082D14A4|nr:ABC-2 transporter permease [Bacillus sp. FJAT-29814]